MYMRWLLRLCGVCVVCAMDGWMCDVCTMRVCDVCAMYVRCACDARAVYMRGACEECSSIYQAFAGHAATSYQVNLRARAARGRSARTEGLAR